MWKSPLTRKNGFYKIENPHNCGNFNYQNPIKLYHSNYLYKNKNVIFSKD